LSPRILIDTFNSGLPQPTGIGTYACVLTHAYHGLGNEVFLLADAAIPRTRGASPDPKDVSSRILSGTDPVILFDHFSDRPRRPVLERAAPVPWYVRNRFFSLRGLARRLHLLSHVPPIHLVPELDRVEQGAVRHRLGHFDGIMNGFDLFQRALAHFHRTREPTVIDLPIGLDLLNALKWGLENGLYATKTEIATAAGRKDRNARNVISKGITHRVWTNANIREWLSLGKKRREALETAAITGALPIARRQLDNDDAEALEAIQN
jgi:hypothetical protein